MPELLQSGIISISGFLLAGLLVGALTGRLWLCLFLAALAFGLRQLHQLHHLRQWAERESNVIPTSTDRPWAAAYAAIDKLRRRDGDADRGPVAGIAALEQAGDECGLVATHSDGAIAWFNHTASMWLELKPGRDVGADIAHLVRSPDFLECFSQGRFGCEVEIGTAASSRQISACVLPYGKAHRLIIIRDLSYFHRLESARRDLIDNISHELRSPLTVIKGYLEVLAEVSEPGRDRRLDAALSAMREQGDRMQDIIADTLRLNELEVSGSGDHIVVDVPSMLRELCNEAGRLHPQGCCRTVAEIDPQSAGQGLLGNRTQLLSAFLNLAGNAVRYSPDGGTITLRWTTDEEGARFCVSDEGIGIDAHHIPRLTERFYRVDKDRSRAGGGTGLGLAIVKHVLQHHDARLEIASTPGAGSCFCCRFPASRVVAATSPSPPGEGNL